jgi:hypothetical protein
LTFSTPVSALSVWLLAEFVDPPAEDEFFCPVLQPINEIAVITQRHQTEHLLGTIEINLSGSKQSCDKKSKITP